MEYMTLDVFFWCSGIVIAIIGVLWNTIKENKKDNKEKMNNLEEKIDKIEKTQTEIRIDQAKFDQKLSDLDGRLDNIDKSQRETVSLIKSLLRKK